MTDRLAMLQHDTAPTERHELRSTTRNTTNRPDLTTPTRCHIFTSLHQRPHGSQRYGSARLHVTELHDTKLTQPYPTDRTLRDTTSRLVTKRDDSTDRDATKTSHDETRRPNAS